MPSIDTAVFQLSALGLLGLILIVAVIALFRLGSLKRALAERPRTTAADVVPFAAPEGGPGEAHEEPEREQAPSPQQESARPGAEEPARPRPEPQAGIEQPDSESAELVPDAGGREAEAPPSGTEERAPVAEEPAAVAEAPSERAEPELVREGPPAGAVAPEEAELRPEPAVEEARGEGAEPAAAAAGTYWPTEETRPAATIGEELEAEPAGERDEGRGERREAEPVGVGEEEPHELVDASGAAGAPVTQEPAREAEAPAETVARPSTVSAQQQVAEGESEFAAERTWEALSEQAETPANGEPSPEPEGVLGAAWAYDWAREMPEEQPIEREGRWWFKRGGELLLYDETTAQWVPAPMPEARSGDEPPGNSNGVEFGGAAAATQASFWKCPSCGAVNGSTASTCRMCFAARP